MLLLVQLPLPFELLVAAAWCDRQEVTVRHRWTTELLVVVLKLHFSTAVIVLKAWHLTDPHFYKNSRVHCIGCSSYCPRELILVAAGWIVEELGGFLSQWAASCWRLWQWGGLKARSQLQRKQKLFHICFNPTNGFKEEKSCHTFLSFLLKWLICLRSQFIGCLQKVIGNLVKLNSRAAFVMLSATCEFNSIYLNEWNWNFRVCLCIVVHALNGVSLT